MSSLLVLLPAGPVSGALEYPYLLSPDGRSASASGRVAAALLPAATGAGSEVVAVVPAAALSWHRVTWPRGLAAGSARLRAALEGLLEEQLLDEPEALHFALEPGARAGSPAWVAVCDRAWLREALQPLESADRAPHRLVPEVAPESPALLLALAGPAPGDQEGQAWLIHRSAGGVRRVPLVPGATELLTDLDEDTLLLAEPALSGQAEALLQRQPVLQPAGQRWLRAAQSRWDLAQFDLLRSGRTRFFKRLAATLSILRSPAWRPARWAALTLLLAQLVGLNAWAWRERSQLQARQEAIKSVLTRNFPQVKVVIDATLQMEREVASLRRATGAPSPADLESMLGALAQVAPERQASSLRFDRQGLQVGGLGLSDTQIQAAAPALRAQGLGVSRQGDALLLRQEARP